MDQEPERRLHFLAEACDDEDLRGEVAALIAQSGSHRDLPDLTGFDSIAPRDAAAALEPGACLGPYRIVGPLGEGGMGKVYRAVDTRLNRAVAVKISTEPFSRRFESEARAISALNHPNICTLFDVGKLPSGAAFMVTELVEGETLRDLLQRSPSIDRCLAVIRQVIEALGAAHTAGIIHRDLKPANIMVRLDGYAKVLDFGLATRISDSGDRDLTGTLTATIPGQILGTIAYMAPEQALGGRTDARGDIFSLGVILYEIAAGRHPWPRGSAVETLHAILHDDPPRTVSPIDAVIRRCLAKPPERRFQSMAELAAALQEIPTPGATHSSIAVLPFANMSGDKENEYFGDGLAEEIINALARLPGVLVTGRTSSFFFRGKDVELAEIGRRLKVGHILDGSVRRFGNRIRITAQLIKVSDGFHAWSARYDREMNDVFAVQDEITNAIAAALLVRLSSESAAPRRRVPDLRAYEAFLEGRHRLLTTANLQSLARGKELLEHAIEIDSGFALPYGLLGVYYTRQASNGNLAPRQAIELARAAEQKALSVDPSLPDAHALLGVCAGMEYDWTAAEAHWQAAMAHEPVPRDVLFWYGNHYLLPIGRAEEAVEVEASVLQSDSLNFLYRHLYAMALHYLGRWSDAEVELRGILELDANSPALGTLAVVCAQQGRSDEALELAERAHSVMPQSDLIAGTLAAFLTQSSAQSRATALLNKLRTSKSYAAPVGMAVYHALAGEFDQAARWAERAIDERYPLLATRLGPLIQFQPQWRELEKRMNLPSR